MGLSLIVALFFATFSCGFLPPMNTSALVINQTNYVSACGLNVLTFTATGRQPFYFDFVLTPVNDDFPNVNFVVNLAPYAPSKSDTSLNAFDPGCATYSCVSNSSAGCVISVACGDQTKPWFAYVQPGNSAEGAFSIDIVVRRMIFSIFSSIKIFLQN